MNNYLPGQKKCHAVLGMLVILMMVIIIFSQLAMEIYAYSFIAGQNIYIAETADKIIRNKKQQEKTLEKKSISKKNLMKKKQAVKTSDMPSAVSFIMPVKNGITTSCFGDTVSRSAIHLGHDWAVNVGTEVHASKAGVVEQAYFSESYGYNVLIYHGEGVKTRYAHLSQLKVEKGQAVERNQVIGLSGNTGDSTGPHLHFEVIKNDRHVNPLEIIEK